jgi:hypothetical protein
MTIGRTLEKWETFTNKLIEHFILKYFEVEDALDVDFYWIGSDVGSVCIINDYFFNMSDIKFCLKNNVEVSKLFEWYNYVLETPDDYINLNSFNMGAEAVIKSRKESLEKSKKAVEESEKLFFKMLKD